MRALLFCVVSLAACGSGEAVVDGDAEAQVDVAPLVTGLSGWRSRLDVVQWNIEWLGHPEHGPTDEALQLRNAAELIASANADLWAVQEISDPSALEALAKRLDGYAVLVPPNSEHYRAGEQRPALVFKTAALRLRGWRLVLTDHSPLFAGRPPLEVQLTATIWGRTLDFTALVVHLKAGATLADWERRQASSALLERHASGLAGPVLVIGDFNDQLSGSNVRGRESPFGAWTGRWAALTSALEDSGRVSSVFGSFIDHALANDALSTLHEASSVHDPRPFVPAYATTTSDHFPVLHRFAMPR